MNPNETRTLWISVGSALFAVFLLYSYTQEKSDQLTQQFGAKKRVVVATRDINEMETINETMVDTIERPVDFIEPSALTKREDAIGKVALAPIRQKEQVLESKIIEPSPVTGLSLQIAPGKRAVTIPVDETRAVAKLIKPGDRIDLVAAIDVGSGNSIRREIKTLMQDVVILATGLRIVNDLPRILEKQGRDEYIKNLRGDVAFASITIEATPQESQDLIYILSTNPSSLYMTLRHPSDRAKVRYPTSTIDSVLGRASPEMINQQLRTPTQVPPAPPAQAPARPRKKGPMVDL